MSIPKEVWLFRWLNSASGAVSEVFPGAAAPAPPFLLAVTLMRWLRWEPSIWAGQTTELLQGTALWNTSMILEVNVGLLSDVRLVPDTNHSFVYKCSRRMLQSASVVLLKAFVRTDYKDLQSHKWKKPEGLLCRKYIVDENPRSEEKWKVKVSMKSGFGLPLTASSPAFRGNWALVDGG